MLSLQHAKQVYTNQIARKGFYLAINFLAACFQFMSCWLRSQ
jgi:hypothetical protein